MFFEAVDRGDVGMVEGSQELGFTFKPYKTIRISGKLFRKRLDRYLATELRVTRTLHLTQAAFAEGGEDFVTAELRAGLH